MQGRLKGQTNPSPNSSTHTPPSSAFASSPLWRHKGEIKPLQGHVVTPVAARCLALEFSPIAWWTARGYVLLKNTGAAPLGELGCVQNLECSHKHPQLHTSSHGTSQKIDREGLWRTSSQTVWGVHWLHLVSTWIPVLKVPLPAGLFSSSTGWF